MTHSSPRLLLAAVLIGLTTVSPDITGRHAVVRDTVRVLSFNIRHGEGLDGRVDLRRTADIIASVAPDLVALQEVDQGTERSGDTHQMAELARLTGLHAAFGKAMDFEGGAYGVGILSRRSFLKATRRPLPGTADREPRSALSVTVRVGEDLRETLQFTSVHFDHEDTGDRLAQARFIDRWTERHNGPAILAGDTNARIDTAVMRIFQERWRDMFVQSESRSTTPVRTRVDHVLATPAGAWRTLESRFLDHSVASDHLPLFVELEFLGSPQPAR